MQERSYRLVLYDGDCGLCNRIVAFVLRNERDQTIRFAAIQSAFTQKLFTSNGWKTPDMNTFYFIDGDRKFEKSTGVIRLTSCLKFPWNWLRVAIIIPRSWRDSMYDAIASRRRRISKGYCLIPTPEQTRRFLS